MLEGGSLGRVDTDDFRDVHWAMLMVMTIDPIQHPGISVDQGSLDREGSLLVQAMPVNDVSDLKARAADVTDPPQRFSKILLPGLRENMIEDAVAALLADLERVTAARVDEPAYVVFQLACDARWKYVDRFIHPDLLPHAYDRCQEPR